MKSVDHYKDGLLSLDYTSEELGVELTCWFEYEPAERGARSRSGEQLEPDYPATWTLHHVYLPGSDVDIAPVLQLAVVEAIEECIARRADDEYQDNDNYSEAEIDAYASRRGQ